MSIALAELLVEKTPWTRENIANKFVEVFKRDERQGYSKHFYKLLCEVSSGNELLGKIKPESERNGAAMRSACLGYLPLNQALEYAEIQARITHDTEIGVKSSQAVAAMSYLSRIGHENIPKALEELVPGIPWSEPWSGAVGGKGTEAVRAALTAVTSHNSLNSILRQCIRYTGDVDTVAIIALSVASVNKGIVFDLPLSLYQGLENGTYGRDFLSELDRKLKNV